MSRLTQISKMSYILIQPLTTQYVHIEFDGQYKGKTVTWDTHFYTLQGYIAHKNTNNTDLKQFIEIESMQTGMMKLTLALNIEKINNPSIRKMMIMIKQYKNLSIGRHEYG